MSVHEHKWFIEYTSPDTAHMFGVDKYIVSKQTCFQQMEIADTDIYGRILILDGKIQSAERDEYIYHEALVQPAMLMHPCPRRVLIIGGGEGATLREVLRHACVEQAVMVDIDTEVVELCKEHLPQWHRGSFDDPRVLLSHMDARRYLEDNDQRFDVIISDIPEPVEEGPARRLFTWQFYRLVRDRLLKGGILALQAGDFSYVFVAAHNAIYNTIKQVMPAVYSYRAFIPSFNTEWSFAVSSREGDLGGFDPEEIDRRIADRKLDLQYYDGETHRGIFAIPRNIRKLREAASVVIDDDRLLTTY